MNASNCSAFNRGLSIPRFWKYAVVDCSSSKTVIVVLDLLVEQAATGVQNQFDNWPGRGHYIRSMRKMKPLLFTLAAACCLGSTAVAADFVVVNTNNQGPGSLYQAITDANANAGRDNIVFNIPGPGVHVIQAIALPQITDPIIIDGYTQGGAHPNTQPVGDNAVILIELDTRTFGGLVISAGTSIVR